MFTVIMMIISIPWNRFLWPLIVQQIGGMLGGGVVNAQTGDEDRGPLVERFTVMLKIILGVWFWLFPRMFLYTVSCILLVDAIQFAISMFKARAGLPSFTWIFNFGHWNRRYNQRNGILQNGLNRGNNNNSYGNQRQGGMFGRNRQNGQYGSRYGNQYNNNQYNRQNRQQMRQQRAYERQQLRYERNLAEAQAAGKKDGEDLWLIKGSKKVYVNATGKIVYSYQKQEYSLQGTELYEQNGVRVYAVKLDGTSESFIEKMNGVLPVNCETAAFSIDLKGKYYFISNQGEVVKDILSGYKSYAVTENTRVRELEPGHCVLEAVLENKELLIVDLSQYHDVLQLKLKYDTKLDIAATIIENGGRDLTYQFEAVEPYSLIPPQRDLMDDEEIKSDEELKQEKPPAGTINGKQAWKVEGLKNAYILENGHFFIKYNGEKLEYTNDGEKVVNSVKAYFFIWGDDSKGLIDSMKEQLSDTVVNKCTKQGDFRLLISKYGSLHNPSAESEKSNMTNLLEEDEEMEHITMQDLKNQLNKGVNGMKALKAKPEEIARAIKNRGMVKDGVYNTGVVDLMCQYGELRCCAYGMQLPVIQALYVGHLIASYAINNIIDKISSNWNEDVPAEKVHFSIVDDIESILGQQETAIVNSWIVKDDRAYYMSIVLDLRDEDLAKSQLMLLKRTLMGVIVNNMQISMQDEVCYITNIIEADKDKLIGDGYDDAAPERYYKINYIETVPNIFKKQFVSMQNEDVKKLQAEFNKECGVLFKIRYPLVEGYKYELGRYMKFMAEDNFLRQLEEQKKVQLIDLSTQGASITKLCTYLDNSVFGTKVLKNKINEKWRKDYFVIRTRNEKGFEFSFFSFDKSFFKSKAPFMDSITKPLLSCAFWTTDKKCVLDTDKPEVVLYMFRHQKE